MAVSTLSPALPPVLDGAWFGLRSVLNFQRDALGALLAAAKLGDVTTIYFGSAKRHLVSHPDLVHQMLVEQNAKYYKTQQAKKMLEPSLGQGLLISDGDFWKRQRKLVQPAFHAKRIENYAEVMVSYSQRLLQKWDTQPDGNMLHDMDEEMMQLTMEIVSKCLFDADVSKDAATLGEAMSVGNAYVSYKFTHPFAPPDWVPTKMNKLGKWSNQVISDTVNRFVRERRASGEDKGDLLSMLLLAADDDGGMTDKQLRDEAYTLFAAGHETTATTLAWAWATLAQHPAAEQKLHDELDTVLQGRAPTFADLPNLTYTDFVVKEILRLYPAAWITSREAVVPVDVGGYTFEAGTNFFISPYVQHHDARYYDEPFAFKPERWANEFEKRIPKMAYLPFSAGPRVCVGNMFAIMEAKLILATLAQKYKLRLAHGKQVQPLPLVTLRVKDGLPMTLERR